MNNWARGEGFAGLGYVTRKGGEFGGPIAKNHGPDLMAKLYDELGLGENDGLFFAAGKEKEAAVTQLISGNISNDCPATLLWKHDNVDCLILN